MADKAPAPDWGVIGAAAAGIATAVAAAFTALRRNPSSTPPTGTDRTEQNLNNAFKMIEQLQEERNHMEARVNACLAEVSELRSKIAALESQVRMLSWPSPGGHPPASLE